MRRAALAVAMVLEAASTAAAVDPTGVFTVSGLPGVTAISLRRNLLTELTMCVPGPSGAIRVATGAFDPVTGAFTLAYVPSALGPGGLGAYCSIAITGTVAPDGSTLSATQVEHSTCVPPPSTCVPTCELSATLPFAGTRVSTTPAPCCGDAIVDVGAGEQCDDGNDATGDCCAPDCTAEPAGGTCDTGDLCRTGACTGFGQCFQTPVCTDQLLFGKKLLLKRAGTREKLVWLAKDPRFVAPAPGGSDDPSLVGATLELFSPFAAPVSMSLPAGTGWQLLGGGTTGYKFRNATAPAGGTPVRVGVLRNGRLLKVVAKSAGFPLDMVLGGVGIRLVSGTQATCSYFHVGTVVTDVPGRFDARDAAATFGSCDTGILGTGSPSGAFLD